MSNRCLIDYRYNVTEDDLQKFDTIYDENGSVKTLLALGTGPHKLLVRAPELWDRFEKDFLEIWGEEYLNIVKG